MSTKIIKTYMAQFMACLLLVACGGETNKSIGHFQGAMQGAPIGNTFSVNGPRKNYSIERNDMGFVITDISDNSGSFTVLNQTNLQFSDFTVNLGVGDKAKTISSVTLNKLIELYVAFFNRVPDANGMSYWIDQVNNGMTIDQVADSFYRAAVTYSNLTGYSDSMSNADFVKVIYKNVLGRTGATVPSDDEINYWAGELSRGTTKGFLVSTMLTSAYTFTGDPTWGWVPQLLTNKVAVGRYFAIQQGLNYNSDADSIIQGMKIAGSVTSNDTASSISLIPLNAANFDFSLNKNSSAFSSYSRSDFRIIKTTDGYDLVSQLTSSVIQHLNKNTVLRFSDMSVALDMDGPQAKIFRLHKVTFGNYPDINTASRWINELALGGSYEGIALALTKTSLFQQMYGFTPIPENLAKGAYSNILVDLGSSVRPLTWSDALSAGTLNIPQVLVGISDITLSKNMAAEGLVSGMDFLEAGINYQPVARVVFPEFVATNSNILLDASGSTVSLSASPKFSWKMLTKPHASNAILDFENSTQVNVAIDAPGIYRFELTVSDGTKFSAPKLFTITASEPPFTVPPYVPGSYPVTTFIGDFQLLHFLEGVGSNVRLTDPIGIAIDPNGNLFVADGSFSRTIVKITPNAVMSKFVGEGDPRSYSTPRDGTRNTAILGQLGWLAIDGDGNIYETETKDHVIKKISKDGTVKTIAGKYGVYGSANGRGEDARFANPTAIAVDKFGVVYVADAFNSSIRKITPDGQVSTLAGVAGTWGATDGIGSNALFSTPVGLAVAPNGDLYVSDMENSRIRIVTPNGVVSTLQASVDLVPPTGFGRYDSIRNPLGMAFNSQGELFVSYYGNHTIRKFGRSGAVTIFAGLPGTCGTKDGSGYLATLCSPSGIVFDKNDNLYVTSAADRTIRKISPTGVVTSFIGNPPNRLGLQSPQYPAFLYSVTNLAKDKKGNLFVADQSVSVIRKITPNGVVSIYAGTETVEGKQDGFVTNGATFNSPEGTAVDREGNVYVTDSRNHTIRKIAVNGLVTTLAGKALAFGSVDGSGESARFSKPTAITCDELGYLYVVDRNNNTIRVIAPNGLVSTLAGSAASYAHHVDGIGSAARFDTMNGITLGPDGNLYVTEVGGAIRVVTKKGVVTTFAGKADEFGINDGFRTDARFTKPFGIVFDGEGNLYISDGGGGISTIRKIDLYGNVTTIAGPGTTNGLVNGLGVNARFSDAAGLLIDINGNLLVAENFGIRRIRLK